MSAFPTPFTGATTVPALPLHNVATIQSKQSPKLKNTYRRAELKQLIQRKQSEQSELQRGVLADMGLVSDEELEHRRAMSIAMDDEIDHLLNEYKAVSVSLGIAPTPRRPTTVPPITPRQPTTTVPPTTPRQPKIPPKGLSPSQTKRAATKNNTAAAATSPTTVHTTVHVNVNVKAPPKQPPVIRQAKQGPKAPMPTFNPTFARPPSTPTPYPKPAVIDVDAKNTSVYVNPLAAYHGTTMAPLEIVTCV